jgi:para-nitrobenzyl esterase
MMRTASFLLACALLASSTLAAPHDDKALQRRTRHGPVVGIDDSATNGTHAWKGVPFAAPPVGAQRWAPPVDPVPWKEPRLTQQFGNACVQYGRIYGPGTNNRYDATIGATLNQAVGSEDCLYLNIWRPADRRGNLPVIVFVHGGSNITGYTADPVYDGAEAGVQMLRYRQSSEPTVLPSVLPIVSS